MDFLFSSRHRDLQHCARKLTDLLMTYEQACVDNNGLDPRAHADIRDAVLDSGLQAVNMPEQWGGAGLTLVEQAIVHEELGRLTGALWDTVWRPGHALRYCTPQQRQRYLVPVIRGQQRDCWAMTEPEASFSPRHPKTTATPTAGGWILQGEKWFVTGGDYADFLIVLAAAGEKRAPTLFLVDKQTPGVTMTLTPQFLRTGVYDQPEVTFTDVVLHRDAVLGGIGNGYAIARSWLTEERLMTAARTIGAAQRALELARNRAIARGRSDSTADVASVQGMLDHGTVDIDATRAYIRQVAWEADNSQGSRTAADVKAAIAKLSAKGAAGRILQACAQALGSHHDGRFRVVQRLSRELRVDRVWEGTCDAQRLVLADELIKHGTGIL